MITQYFFNMSLRAVMQALVFFCLRRQLIQITTIKKNPTIFSSARRSAATWATCAQNVQSDKRIFVRRSTMCARYAWYVRTHTHKMIFLKLEHCNNWRGGKHDLKKVNSTLFSSETETDTKTTSQAATQTEAHSRLVAADSTGDRVQIRYRHETLAHAATVMLGGNTAN